ncbi:TPA: hypothetical protein ACH3X2_006718 [Trebouxia sp. C0005]
MVGTDSEAPVPLTALTSESLSLLQQLRATSWAVQLDEASASFLSELCIGAGQWTDAAHVFEQRKTVSPVMASSSTANKAEAAVRLMRGMQSPLPLPDMGTFSCVITYVHLKLHDCMPAYQLLMRTHQQVLLKLHMQSGKAPETAKDYHAAMADFDTTNLSANQRPHTPTCIQTMLLMAHNGLLELSAKGCKLLLEAVDEVLASAEDAVTFPPMSPAALVIQQLDTQKAYLDFAEDDMPHFMVLRMHG